MSGPLTHTPVPQSRGFQHFLISVPKGWEGEGGEWPDAEQEGEGGEWLDTEQLGGGGEGRVASGWMLSSAREGGEQLDLEQGHGVWWSSSRAGSM